MGKSEGARDVMGSTYFEGGTIREGKRHKGQGLGGEIWGEQGEVGQLHQEARAARVSNEGRRRDASEGGNGLGGVDKHLSESESEDALRQAKAFA